MKSTRVVVCCYQGDAKQVIDMLPALWTHHGWPVSIFSPLDSPVLLSGTDCRAVGGRAYFGQTATSRHLEYLKVLLTYPEEFFLMCESDSFCIDPIIPEYLYSEPDTFWSNCINDEDPAHNAARPGSPFVSFQAPWFMSRATVEKLIAAAEKVEFHPDLKWVDLYLVQLAHAAGIKWSPFKDAVCCPIAWSIHGEPASQWQKDTYAVGLQIGKNRAREGANMIHSCKSLEAGLALMAEYIKGRN
jgi:hypothetical protein